MTEEKEGVELSQPELVEVTFNNEVVKVPKEAADKFTEMEHNLKSGYDKKLETERAEIQVERDDHKKNLNQDLINVNALMAKGVTDFTSYKPLIEDGDGKYHGVMPTPEEEAEPAKQQAPAFNNDDAFTKLTKKLDDTNDRLDALDRRDANQALDVAEGLVKTYPGAEAYSDAVKYIDMPNFHREHGRAPEQDEIRKMFSERHSKIVPFTKKDKPDTPAIPDMTGGGRPNIPKRELKPGALADTDALTQAAMDSVSIEE